MVCSSPDPRQFLDLLSDIPIRSKSTELLSGHCKRRIPVPGEKVSIRFTMMLAIFAATLLAKSTRATAQSNEFVLHSFPVSTTDGWEPNGNVIFKGATQLYGTTPFGGINGRGTVFELVAKRGVWSETVPHPFDPSSTDGYPNSAGLLLHAGKLYGTTQGGSSGYGTVFELTYTAGIGWAKTFEYAFPGFTNDGQGPNSPLIFANGNLYGTTGAGGSNLNCGTSGENVGCGTVFELTPAVSGGWTESVIYNFGSGTDGQIPVGVVFHGGNLYGMTQDGGLFGEGMVFELNPKTAMETDLYDFPMPTTGGTTGAVPNFGLVADLAGNLYGTTSQGGTHNNGIAFELTYDKATKIWTPQDLHDFYYLVDGAHPSALLLDTKSGNLYGTTEEDGPNGTGVAFELVPGTPWTENILYSFCSLSSCTDGSYPSSGLTFDTNYNLYGVTQEGGAYGWGAVFQIILNGFTLSASPSTLAVAQGGNDMTTISVNDTGSFTGNVTLTASGLPKGVTASFNSKITSSTSTLTLTASPTAKLETGATVTITGTSGNLAQTALINVSVIP
jgi:uncharacterized repeat protein (TIGR03803 family)